MITMMTNMLLDTMMSSTMETTTQRVKVLNRISLILNTLKLGTNLASRVRWVRALRVLRVDITT